MENNIENEKLSFGEETIYLLRIDNIEFENLADSIQFDSIKIWNMRVLFFKFYTKLIRKIKRRFLK